MSIGFARTPSAPLADSDSTFLQQLKWLEATPKQVRKAAKKGDVSHFVLAYRAWLEPFATRFRRHMGARRLSVIGRADSSHDGLASLIDEYSDSRSKRGDRFGLGRAIVGWVQGASGELSDGTRLTVLELLLNPPLDLEVETWCRLWRLALISSESAGANSSRQTYGVSSTTESAIVGSLFFGLLINSDKVRRKASQQLDVEMLASTDTDGTPHADTLHDFSHWFAPFVRAGWWGRAFRQPVFSSEGLARFAAAATRATELCRRDGCFAFEKAGRTNSARILLPLAARVGKLSKATDVGQFARSFPKKAKSSRANSKRLPSSQSDWAAFAHLRTGRTIDADLAVVAFSGDHPNLELSCLGTPVLSGAWMAELSVSGKMARSGGEWSCTCWYSDKDGDYLELQRADSGGVRIERQLFLSRKQHFALLQDVVRVDKPGKLKYRVSLPVANDVMNRADFLSREWRLHTGRMPVRVFPVSLIADRVLSSAGECTVEDGRLVLEVEGQQSVVASLVLDWHPKRRDADAEWTRLTVTESREVLGPSEAMAFRIRVGNHQLVSYRNTSDSKELRAVLGQHTARETSIGTLNKSGVFEPLVLVDPDTP